MIYRGTMEAEWGSPRYVSDQFRRWYSAHSATIPAPTEIRRREFAFLSFGGKTMFRHIGFGDEAALRRHLADNAPAHCYHSSSYYKNPEAEMSGKGWLGADLVFDIDADHFNLPCQKEHDRWRCRTCGAEGTGKPPELCACGKAAFEAETWLCERCLRTAKHETQKLLDILIQDFGADPSRDMVVNFSGNRGYHVHVRSQAVRTLDQSARREIVDYIKGTGLDPEYMGFSPQLRGGAPSLAEEGWRGRAGRSLYDYMASATPEEVKALKIGRSATRNILERREEVLESLREKPPNSLLRLIDTGSLDKIMAASIREQAADIDTVVSTDIHRLIRLPNTLHGKTGWQVQTVQIDRLADYDPMNSAIAFKEGTDRVHVRSAPRFRIGETEYGPYGDETVEVPTAVAMFLLCKKGARIEP